MATETEILTIVTALNVFVKARYLVAEADSETTPTQLPIFVLNDGGSDLSQFATFCGTDLVDRTFEAVIIAETAAEVRSLTNQVSTALKGVVALDSVSESYDSELRAFVGEITLS